MMENESGKLVVAVSGGIDSVVLLDQLVAQKMPLIVAHVDHGIRSDSAKDKAFVQQLANNYDVPFVSVQLHLGPDSSEEKARHARYEWLETVRLQNNATAIATAHHEDDIFETICINIIRGTGWRGICSLRETVSRKRPLLGWSKAAIVAYALENELKWREDSTNESARYLRNRIRQAIIPRLDPAERKVLKYLYNSQLVLRNEIDNEIENLYKMWVGDKGLARYPVIMSPSNVSQELLRSWLGESLEQVRLHDLEIFVKTAKTGARWSLDAHRYVLASKKHLIVLTPRG